MRILTENERAVLAYIVVDPDAWWAHANVKDGSDGKRSIDHEEALKAKVAHWQEDYTVAKLKPGYKDRATRDAEDEAV